MLRENFEIFLAWLILLFIFDISNFHYTHIVYDTRWNAASYRMLIVVVGCCLLPARSVQQIQSHSPRSLFNRERILHSRSVSRIFFRSLDDLVLWYQRILVIFNSLNFVFAICTICLCFEWWRANLGAHFTFETMATMRLFNVKLFKSVYKLKLSSTKGKSVKPFTDWNQTKPRSTKYIAYNLRAFLQIIPITDSKKKKIPKCLFIPPPRAYVSHSYQTGTLYAYRKHTCANRRRHE